MANKDTLCIASDFSEYPGPRYISQGECSGEQFYIDFLNKKFAECLKEHKRLQVNLDSSAGYATSFLDEAFGELVYDFGYDIVKENLDIISTEEPEWIDTIQNETYVEWEKRRKEKKSPKVTTPHVVCYYNYSTDAVETHER